MLHCISSFQPRPHVEQTPANRQSGSDRKFLRCQCGRLLMEPPAGLALLTLPRLALWLGVGDRRESPQAHREPTEAHRLHCRSQPRQVGWRVLTEANTAASNRFIWHSASGHFEERSLQTLLVARKLQTKTIVGLWIEWCFRVCPVPLTLVR